MQVSLRCAQAAEPLSERGVRSRYSSILAADLRRNRTQY